MFELSIGPRSAYVSSLPLDKMDSIVNLVLGLLGIVLSVVAVWQGYWIWRIWTRGKKEQENVIEEIIMEEEGERCNLHDAVN